jgi:Rod binding domain-containing protein
LALKLRTGLLIDKIAAPIQYSKEPAKPVPSDRYVPESYKEVARNVESQFAELMLQEMEKSVGREGGDSASEFYQSVMNGERSKTMSTHDQGLGVSKIILDQIYPERLRNQQTYEYFQRMNQNANMPKSIAKYESVNSQTPPIKIYASTAKEANYE